MVKDRGGMFLHAKTNIRNTSLDREQGPVACIGIGRIWASVRENRENSSGHPGKRDEKSNIMQDASRKSSLNSCTIHVFHQGGHGVFASSADDGEIHPGKV